MDARLTTLERVYKALADRTRLRILGLLANGEVCVCELQDSLNIPQPKTSRHLAYLKRAGLVADRRDGLWVHYRLAPPSDPLIESVVSTALHSLGHLTSTARDLKRLEKQMGQPVAPVAIRPRLSCCGT